MRKLLRLFSTIDRYLFVYQFILLSFVLFIIVSAWAFSEYQNFQITQKKHHDLLLDSNRKTLSYEGNKLIGLIDLLRNNVRNDSLVKEIVINYLVDYPVDFGGYVFVNHLNGDAIIFDGKRIFNKSIIGMKDKQGMDLYQKEKDLYNSPNGGFMEYWFSPKFDTIPIKKISYITGYKDFNWIIGVGNYIDFVEVEYSDFYDFFYQKLKQKVIFIFGFYFGFLLLFYLFSKRLSFLFNEILISLNAYIDGRLAGKTADQSIIKKVQFDEIVGFVHKFDYLANRQQILEQEKDLYAQNLEQLVEDRTATLKFQASELMQKNEDLEAFNYSVSHDLKVPIRIINYHAQSIIEDEGNIMSDDSKNKLDLIRLQSQLMMNLLRDLLKFSVASRQMLNPTEIFMEDLFLSLSIELKDQYSSPKLEINIEKMPNLIGDYTLVKQLAINLLSNAIKFSAKVDSPKVVVGYKVVNGLGYYFVKDNGIGMSVHDKDRIFGLFVRLKSSSTIEGTGVGLAIVKRVVDKHGGSLYVDTDINMGMEIGFTFNN